MSNKVTLKSAVECLLIDLYSNTNLKESELNCFAKKQIKNSKKLFETQIKEAYLAGHRDRQKNIFKMNTYFRENYEY